MLLPMLMDIADAFCATLPRFAMLFFFFLRFVSPCHASAEGHAVTMLRHTAAAAAIAAVISLIVAYYAHIDVAADIDYTMSFFSPCHAAVATLMLRAIDAAADAALYADAC